MSIENPCFLKIFKECNRIIKNSNDKNILSKHEKLKKSCQQLLCTKDTELQQFYSVVTEIRTYDYLKNKNLNPIAHNDNSAGPDFISDLGYIECICLTKGEPNTENRKYVDRLLSGCMNRNKSVFPRLSAAVKDKTEQYKKYIANRVIDENKPRLIAINSSVFSNEFHSDLVTDNLLKVLYGIGCQTIRVYPQANKIKQESEKIETHCFEITGRKNDNIILEVGYFFNEDYSEISAIILENNAITEKLSDNYFMVFINPLAKIKIDEKILSNIKYFHLSLINDAYADFKWENLKNS